MAEVGNAIVNLDVRPDELVRVLRIISRHAAACADELAGDVTDGMPKESEVDLEEIKRQREERHARLGGARR